MPFSDDSRDFFSESITSTYDRIHGKVRAARQEILQQKYYHDLIGDGDTVLDIGNGGHTPEELVGDEIARRMSFFVGSDNSVGMINRKPTSFPRLVADGRTLPFGQGAFDFVLINGVLHHLGFSQMETHPTRCKQLLSEALRISRKGVIIYEPVLWNICEHLERLLFPLLGKFPLYMLSKSSFSGLLQEMGVKTAREDILTLSQLTHPFYWYPLVMNPSWFKLPAFISPIDHYFLYLESTSGA